MKPKQIIILSVIFFALAFGVFLKSWIRSASDKAGSGAEDQIALTAFEPSKLERILIERADPAYRLELAKENGVWKVKTLWSAQADAVKVEKLIQTFRSLRGELRGSGEKLLSDFGIQDAEAFSIKFFGTGEALLQDLRLGTKQAGNSGYFFRKAASEDVFLAHVDMAEIFGVYEDLKHANPTDLFWADLKLFNMDPEKVTKIMLYDLKGGEKIRKIGLERVEDPKDPLKSSWKFLHQEMSSPADPDKVVKFIAAMNSVRADRILDPKGEGYGLEKPAWQLIATVDGKKTLLSAGTKNDKEELYYVKRSWDPAVLGLKMSFFNDLNFDDTCFLKDAPVSPEASKDISGQLPASMPEDLDETS